MDEAAFIKLIPDEASMLVFGQQLARAVLHQGDSTNEVQKNPPKVLFLYGPLGAGKTTLARGFLQGLDHPGRVKSPTYTLVESYELPMGTVFHFDLYRIAAAEELEFMGIQDYFTPGVICLIEWPERGKGLLPAPDLSCYISLQAQSREIKLIAQSAYGAIILQRLQHGK